MKNAPNITEVCINVWKLKYIMLNRRVTMVFVDKEKGASAWHSDGAVSICWHAKRVEYMRNA